MTTPYNNNHPPPDNQEIDTTSDDLTRFGCIAEQIAYIDEIVNKDFTKYDQDAMLDRSDHIFFAHTAVITGTLAILITLLQLTGFLPEELSLPVETFVTLLSVSAVVLGSLWAFQKRWLVERFKAESLRILKFRALLKSDFLCGNIGPWKLWLEGEIEKIRKYEKSDIHAIIKTGAAIRLPKVTNVPVCNYTTVVSVAEYFRKNLVTTQIEYFQKTAQEMESSDRFIRYAPYLFFSLGVVIVAIHFIINDLVHEGEWHVISNFLILLAIAFPVLGMGVRTYRSSHEFARSASIFRAKEKRLLEIEAEITLLLNEPPGNRMQLISLLNACEHQLEEEHYEWLRLMAESEWFL
jgi:hypothetical protein